VAVREQLAGSAVGQSLQVLGVASALHRDLRGGGLDLAEVIGRQLRVDGADVLVETLQPAGAGDRDDPGLLGERPRQGDLRGGGVLACGDRAEQVDQGLVRLAGLGGEAGDGGADVGAVERRGLVDLPGAEALAERTDGTKPISSSSRRGRPPIAEAGSGGMDGGAGRRRHPERGADSKQPFLVSVGRTAVAIIAP
jgi:hypothetical protein